MKSFSITFDRIAIASAILLGLALLLFPCVAEARVHINIPPQGNPQYEEPQHGTASNVIIPEQDYGSKNDDSGSDGFFEVALAVLQLLAIAPIFAPVSLLFGLLRDGSEALDSNRQQIAQLKYLLKCQENIRAKKRALAIFASLVLLFALPVLVNLFRSPLPSLTILSVVGSIVFALWYSFGAVVAAALPAQDYYEKRLNPIKSK